MNYILHSLQNQAGFPKTIKYYINYLGKVTSNMTVTQE